MRWSPLDKRSSKFQDDDDDAAAAADLRSNNNNNAKSKRNEQFAVDDESPSVSTWTSGASRHGRRASNIEQCSSSSFSRSSSSLLFSRGGSRRSHTPTAAMQRTASRRSSSATKNRRRSKTPGPTPPPPLEVPAVNMSKIMSTGGGGSTTPNDFRRTISQRSTTPIVFSHSSPARKKAAPVEMKLECTLEELCFGAVKRINITRDVINEAGMIVKEEETLKINVKPGWIKGTKITFQGKGDEKPGYLPADIVFSIDELPHPVFKRRRVRGSGTDDLELRVEVPLVKALTGCAVSLPLIGGERISLRIDDEVIHPDYEKVIVGQGMGVADGDGRRGDLWLRFSVRFPDQLSTEKREEIAAILRESFANELMNE